jgi:hypothetical protein
MSTIASDAQSPYPGVQDPTSASTWLALSGCPITDEILEWPPDLFALTDVILDYTQAYRFVFSPPGEMTWPPNRFTNWGEAVEEAGRDLSNRVENQQGAPPDLLAQQWGTFREHSEMPLDDLAEGRNWQMCEAADASCNRRRGLRGIGHSPWSLRRKGLRVSRSGPRTVGQNRLTCSRPPRPGAVCYRKSVLRPTGRR